MEAEEGAASPHAGSSQARGCSYTALDGGGSKVSHRWTAEQRFQLLPTAGKKELGVRILPCSRGSVDTLNENGHRPFL